jgi:hypothetical protein
MSPGLGNPNAFGQADRIFGMPTSPLRRKSRFTSYSKSFDDSRCSAPQALLALFDVFLKKTVKW